MGLRFVAIAVCIALLELAVPESAHAWWEYIEQLSGPGPFRGVDVQGRLFCWVRPPVTDAKTNEVMRDQKTNEVTYGETEFRANFVPGLIVSLCKIDQEHEVRRASIDLGFAFRWTSHDTRFANSERIYMMNLQPAVTFNVFSAHPDSDYLDVGAGAGVYWFRSKDFSTFSGGYIEPLRIEFHPTTNFKRRYKGKSALVPVLRVGYLFFPNGFDTTKFNATSPTQIGPDWTFKAGVFFDLDGLIR